jgi:hypothetical protein
MDGLLTEIPINWHRNKQNWQDRFFARFCQKSYVHLRKTVSRVKLGGNCMSTQPVDFMPVIFSPTRITPVLAARTSGNYEYKYGDYDYSGGMYGGDYDYEHGDDNYSAGKKGCDDEYDDDEYSVGKKEVYYEYCGKKGGKKGDYDSSRPQGNSRRRIAPFQSQTSVILILLGVVTGLGVGKS